ncbi:MAG: hypothetical protein Q8L48_00590 [Archangium sp.]|nr:hypothetical protein [Archangium sp.]
MEPYRASSVHIAGFVAAAKRLGFFEKALPLLAPETRHVLEHPFDAKWVPAQVIQDLTARVAEQYGPECLDPLNFAMTKDSLGRLVLPMLRVALAITGRSPATVFSRLGDSVKIAMQGVSASWLATSANGGVVTLRYPEAPPAVVHHAWQGVFRFAFELTSREGRLVAHRYLDGGKTVELDVAWT